MNLIAPQEWVCRQTFELKASLEALLYHDEYRPRCEKINVPWFSSWENAIQLRQAGKGCKSYDAKKWIGPVGSIEIRDTLWRRAMDIWEPGEENPAGRLAIIKNRRFVFNAASWLNVSPYEVASAWDRMDKALFARVRGKKTDGDREPTISYLREVANFPQYIKYGASPRGGDARSDETADDDYGKGSMRLEVPGDFHRRWAERYAEFLVHDAYAPNGQKKKELFRREVLTYKQSRKRPLMNIVEMYSCYAIGGDLATDDKVRGRKSFSLPYI